MKNLNSPSAFPSMGRILRAILVPWLGITLMFNGAISVIGKIAHNLGYSDSIEKVAENPLLAGKTGNLSIKIITYSKDGEDFITKERIISNVQWAKIARPQTIGATTQTLCYVDANNKSISTTGSFFEII